MVRADRRLPRCARAALAAACALAAGGCSTDLFHSTDWPNQCSESACDSASDGGGEGGASGGSGSGGGGGPCAAGASQVCYDGPAGTQDVGACKAGNRVCLADGSGYGPCAGEVTPKAEVCGDAIDDDCDGALDDCVIASCAALHASSPQAADGVYTIDPDDSGPLPPVASYCDMTTDGGGWTLLAKTVLAGLTPAEAATVRESHWIDYTATGYGDPALASRIYWLPLTHWHALTTADAPHELVSRTGTTAVVGDDFQVADEAGKYAWSWKPPIGKLALWNELNGANFTARDADNDSWPGNCSTDNVGLNGGFWYTSCGQLSMLHSSGKLYRLDSNTNTSVQENTVWLR